MTTRFSGNIDGKNVIIKKQILGLCMSDDWSIAELSKELSCSSPTITKLVGELIDEKFLEDMGKQGTSGGRRPSIFGLNPKAGYLAGVDVNRKNVSFAITDFKGKIVDFQEDIPFVLENTEESFNALCDLVRKEVHAAGIDLSEVVTCGFNLSGRVNSESGYSFTYMLGEYKPLAELLHNNLGIHVTIENDSRAMTYAEYLTGCTNGEKNMIFINVNWGLGMGMIVNGKLYYGRSGYSGELGHFPMLSNNVICRCGKLGCLETGASASAVHRIIGEKLREGRSSLLSAKYEKGKEITIDDIVDAALAEDVLVIEVIEDIGSTLGKAIAGIINLFNPELVVIGGKLAATKDYLMLPVKSAVNKHSLNIVSQNTAIKFSKLGNKCGALGACLLSRSKLIGII
jgi:predicted NBD/HSP70 family sugar kinase